MRRRNHADDEVDDIEPDGGIADPADLAQASNETASHADSHDDDHHGDEADLGVGDLLDVESLAKNQDRDREELLEGLGDVDEVSHLPAVESQERVTETLHRVARRIEVEESLPDDIATPGSEDTEDQVESNAGAVADGSEDEPFEVLALLWACIL
jgi:hypothetical protein